VQLDGELKIAPDNGRSTRQEETNKQESGVLSGCPEEGAWQEVEESKRRLLK